MKSGLISLVRWFAYGGLAMSFPVMASGGGGKGPAEGINYIPITPALVVNYGGPGKTRFIKAELSIRTENAEYATQVMHHLPLIRDRLVSILSAQTEEVISTAEGKEQLRVYALAEINKALLLVEGRSLEEFQAEAKGDTEEEEEDESEDKDNSGDKTDESSAAASSKAATGPASDLYFNNFVVQK